VAEDKDIKLRRDEEFESLYANNVNFESSVWDLKMIFGQLDQEASAVTQHTAMTLPWSTSKIAAYYMLVNLLVHQADNGAITIPARVVPPRPDPESPTVEPHMKPVISYVAWIHDQFFGINPYVPPEVNEEIKRLAALDVR